MPVPGYDPDDLDRLLRNRLEDPEQRAQLSDEERAALDSDADLVDALDEETIRRLVDR